MSNKINWDNAARASRAIRHGAEYAYTDLPPVGTGNDRIRYFKEHKVAENNDKQYLLCPVCEASLDCEFDLWVHLKNVHKKYMCPKCGTLNNHKFANNPCSKCNYIDCPRSQYGITGILKQEKKKTKEKKKKRKKSKNMKSAEKKPTSDEKKPSKKEDAKSSPKPKNHNEPFGNNLGKILQDALDNKK